MKASGPDFLVQLAQLRERHGPVFKLRPGEIYVADPLLAKEILANNAGDFQEHSDFFRIKGGTFGPRQAQADIGRAARQLLQRHLRAAALPELVAQHLARSSSWPDAGNRLLLAHFHDALVGVDASQALQETVHAVVERAVLAGGRGQHSWLSRARFRARAMGVLSAEIAARRGQVHAEPKDMLEVLAQTDGSDRDLAEVYLSCLFAVVGSIGFLLGWSLYLLGTSDERDAPAASVVREALRLSPVAWLFGRRPAHKQEIGGIPVSAADDVFVCSYLVHREPGYWPDPAEFRPSRWESAGEAFIPFGWGQHACTGAAVSMQIVEALIEIVTSRYKFDVTAPDSRPQVAAALAPPGFTLRLDEIPGGGEVIKDGENRARRS